MGARSLVAWTLVLAITNACGGTSKGTGPMDAVGVPKHGAMSACGAWEIQADPGVQHFVSARQRTWEPGSELHVVFLDGKPEYRAKVAEFAREWTRYANIALKFDDVNAADADVRVTFKLSGYWSAVGNSSAYYDRDRPTMNFNWDVFDDGDRSIKRVVLHEFGHALGLHHEQQNPNLNVTWNRPYIYDYYRRTQGWDEKMVDTNVLSSLDRAEVEASEFDAQSIMLYGFPKEFTLEGFETSSNYELSDLDKQEIARLYPGRVDPEQPEVVAPPAREDEVAQWARQISFDFAITADEEDGKHHTYRIAVSAPPEVLAEIDHVLYQRQDKTFVEFAKGQYWRSAGADHAFEFEWRGYSWAPIAAKVVFHSGAVTEHMHRAAPSHRARTIDMDAVRAAVRLRYLQTPPDAKGWGIYQVDIDVPEVWPFISHVEYQRQHETFAEYKAGKMLPGGGSEDRFALPWKGYAWVPVTARVHFSDGSSQDYVTTGAPTVVELDPPKPTGPTGDDKTGYEPTDDEDTGDDDVIPDGDDGTVGEDEGVW